MAAPGRAGRLGTGECGEGRKKRQRTWCSDLRAAAHGVTGKGSARAQRTRVGRGLHGTSESSGRTSRKKTKEGLGKGQARTTKKQGRVVCTADTDTAGTACGQGPLRGEVTHPFYLRRKDFRVTGPGPRALVPRSPPTRGPAGVHSTPLLPGFPSASGPGTSGVPSPAADTSRGLGVTRWGRHAERGPPPTSNTGI